MTYERRIRVAFSSRFFSLVFRFAGRAPSAINVIFEMPRNVYASAYTLSKNKQIGRRRDYWPIKKKNERRKIDESGQRLAGLFLSSRTRRHEGWSMPRIRIKQNGRSRRKDMRAYSITVHVYTARVTYLTQGRKYYSVFIITIRASARGYIVHTFSTYNPRNVRFIWRIFA